MTDALYDPYGYDANPSDAFRRKKLLAALPQYDYKRVLDFGCGNAFMTQILPGEKVIGIDPDAQSIDTARKRGLGERFEFFISSIYDIYPSRFGKFDLIVITGVLYIHFVGRGFSVITQVIDNILNNNGVLAVCNLSHHKTMSFSYMPVLTDIYHYRTCMHRLDIYQKLSVV